MTKQSADQAKKVKKTKPTPAVAATAPVAVATPAAVPAKTAKPAKAEKAEKPAKPAQKVVEAKAEKAAKKPAVAATTEATKPVKAQAIKEKKQEKAAVKTAEPEKKAEKADKKKKVKVQKKTKAIKKVDPAVVAEKKVKAIVKPKIADYAAFVSAEAQNYAVQRKRTIAKIKLDKDQVKKAAKSLLKFYSSAKKTNDLLDNDDDFIYVEIVLSKVPEEYSIRPLQIALPTPIYSAELGSKFCIFTKDPQRAYKDKIKDLEIPTVARVLGYSKIDKKFPTYKDKLKLFYSYDMFFVDYSIYDLIRKPTGKIFYERKKIPFPVNCSEVPAPHKEQFGQDYQAYLNDLANYTYFSMGNGPVYTVKVARTNMNVKDIVKNVIHGIYNTLPHLLKQKIKHSCVRQINIKTYNSISLPIFHQLTDEEKLALAPTPAQQ